MKKRIVVLVSGGGTNLQAIIDATYSGVITSGEIVAVISSQDGAFALQRAKKNGIATLVLQKKNYGPAFMDALLSAVQGWQPDLVVLAGFMCILPAAFIKAFENRMINVHPSLIPSFCGEGFFGIHVHEKALEYGVKVSGATAHFVNEVTDGGAIILQKAVEVKKGDTPQTLQKRVMEQAEWEILPQAIELFCSEKIKIEGRVTKTKERRR